jgi:hypothetical protein
MTDIETTDRRLSPEPASNGTEPLPLLVEVTASFAARMPSQRIIDLLKRLEPDVTFTQLIEDQPPRLMAFRALRRDYPDRDPTSLWLHAYDVEVAVTDVDPTSGKLPTSLPSSAPTTA